MTDRTALLEQILESPADDTARLVLADLLRESDDPDEQARGRFLWAGVTASHFRENELIDDPAYYTAHQEIEAVAGSGHPPQWLAELGIGSGLAAARDWLWDCTHDRVTVRLGPTSAVFSRGMLCQLKLTLDLWYTVAATVLRSEPLEAVAVANVPGLTFAIDPVESQWRLTARLKLPNQRIPLLGGPIPTSMSPGPILLETDRDWRVEQLFPTRTELVRQVVDESRDLVSCLKETAGRSWPRPLR